MKVIWNHKNTQYKWRNKKIIEIREEMYQIDYKGIT